MRRGNLNGRPLVDNPAVSTILIDIDRVFDLAEGMTGSIDTDEGSHERERIARARAEVPKMLRRLQVLESALKRASKKEPKA